ncbi:MAG TPA: hypothetical protein VGD21_01380 [Lysobacter sp.]
MGKLLRGLHKLGLVEIEDEPVPAPAEEPAPPAELNAALPDATTAPVLPSDIVENRPFEDLYREHQIPPSPYAAEKLLKVLDGLRAMQPEMRRTAVLAIDSADDSWAVEDAVLDAMRKIKVLETAKQGLTQAAQAAVANAQSELEAREQQQQEAITHIRKQIADLEAMLAREVEGATRDKADIQAAKRAAEEACLRERMRIDAQIELLQDVPRNFGSDDKAAPPSA